jgi:xylulokinase
MSELILGIDIGTSACKVALFTPEGSVVAQNSVEYKVYYLRQGWVEQNPDEWWEAVCTAIKEMLERNVIDIKDIVSIGVDGQSWSAIPVDMDGSVLCNTPIWMDTRASEICENLRNEVGEETVFSLCGNSLEPAYTLPKILWYKQYRNHVYNKSVKILQSNSFIVYRLTDRISQDKSQGYGLQCFDMRRGEWNEDMCKMLGVDQYLLPDIYASHEIVGKVTAQAAALTGLAEGTPVAAGGLDAACGTLGAGVLNNGQTQEQGGQAGGMSICIEKYNADPRLILSYHVVPGKWLLQGGTVGGGGVIRWFEKEFGMAERLTAQANNTTVMAEMDRLAQTVNPGCDGVVFLPYMAGERSPIWDKYAKGVYYGLDYSKTRAHMIRATLESVAYSLKHNIDIAENAGADVNELHAMGGAANSSLWVQIKADVTGKKICVPSSDTATTLGAAMLAGVGVGLYRDFDEAVSKTVRIRKEFNPDMINHKKYQINYQLYLELYQKLKDTMKAHTEI